MKNRHIRLFFLILFATSFSNCYSQTSNDSLKQVSSSKTFTLVEDYTGDWGGHLHTFAFTIKGNDIRIQWENPELVKNGKDLDVLLPVSVLNNLENIFINCSQRIMTSKKGSTEHILYKFKNDKLTYIIDDRFTMECNDDFKAWKEMLLLEWRKQEIDFNYHTYTDTIQSNDDKINLIITYNDSNQCDYVAEHESGVSDTNKYAKDRDVNKGQIYFPCKNIREHDYKILKNKIVSIISIKYEMSVYDKTDYVFTQDSIFEIHTSTANAGIFTNSYVKVIQNNLDIFTKTISPVKNNEYNFNDFNKPCSFNDYLFYLTLNFCKKYNIKIK